MKNAAVLAMAKIQFNLTDEHQAKVVQSDFVVDHYEFMVEWWEDTVKKEALIEIKPAVVRETDYTPKEVA